MKHAHCGHGKEACVRTVPIFNHLDQKQMDEVMLAVRSIQLKKGEIMYHAGDHADSLYIVHQGRIKIYRLSESGKEQLVQMLHPGDFTGELALFQDDVHEAYAEALTASDICTISKADFAMLLSKYPMISMKVLQEFSNRLANAERQSTSFATEKVKLRIAHFLVECMERDGGNQQLIELPMSKKDLASYLGTTPETLSRRLTEFEEAGFIKQEGHRTIRVMDADELLLVED